MAQTVEQLMEAGLTKAEAERVVKRRENAAKKSESQVALAEKRLPKAQEQADHAAARQAHWTEVAAKAQAKVDKYVAIISGESTEEAPAEEADEAGE